MSSSTLHDVTSGATGGTQGTTQDPQVSSAGQSTNLQPSDTVSLLTSNGGIPLQTKSLPTTALTATVADQTPSLTAARSHAINPLLLSVSIVLFIAAIVIFISTTRSAKTTTI